jgi:hypothetical protein
VGMGKHGAAVKKGVDFLVTRTTYCGCWVECGIGNSSISDRGRGESIR